MGLEVVNYEELWKQLYEFYGDRLAHPDREPRRFAKQLKLFKHINNIKDTILNADQPTR